MACKDCVILDFHRFLHVADADHSLYVRKNEHDIVIICIYVDDLIVGGDNEVEIAHVKTLMKK